jgi:hypothetical protein
MLLSSLCVIVAVAFPIININNTQAYLWSYLFSSQNPKLEGFYAFWYVLRILNLDISMLGKNIAIRYANKSIAI